MAREPHPYDDPDLTVGDYSIADRIAIRFVRWWIRDIEQSYIRFIEEFGGAAEKTRFELLRSINAEIDGRVSGLLGHISIMIAVCGLFAANLDLFTTSGDRLNGFQIFIAVELIGYLLIAVLLMRCIQAIRFSGIVHFADTQKMTGRTMRYFYAKRELYYIAVTATTVLTIVLVAVLIVKLADRLWF